MVIGGAEKALLSGRVWIGDGPRSAPGAPTAVAIRGGRVVAVGTDADVLEAVGPGAERIDLAGRRVVPGFMDSHTHFLDGGFGLAGVQLRDAASPAEFTRRVEAFVRAHPGAWVTHGAWDHERWGGALPHRSWIDAVTPNTPVFVSRLDAHMALANSAALARAGISSATPDPAGGVIVRDADGVPTGILKDEAMELVFRVIPPPTDAAVDRALDAAVRHAVARGVTHVTDMGGGEASWAGLAAYRRANADRRLALRAYVAVPIATWRRMAEYVAGEGREDGRVRWGLVKGFVDGSLGSGTAWFQAPYSDDAENTGIQVTDPGALRADILGADAAGLHVAVHAIGDRANDWLLDVYADARAANAPRDRRFRIEHAQHLTRAAIGRFGRDGVIAAMQPYHLIDDGRWAERRIGAERAGTAYAIRSLLAAGATVAFGSDWTVAPIDPLLGVHAAVTREPLDGSHAGGWIAEERIGVADAVTAYTRANAYAGFRDGDLGVLAPGHCADLVLLSDDIITIDPARIPDVRVDLTMVEGEIVFRRDAAIA